MAAFSSPRGWGSEGWIRSSGLCTSKSITLTRQQQAYKDLIGPKYPCRGNCYSSACKDCPTNNTH